MDTSKFKARIAQIHKDLDQYNYYELLNLTPEADSDQVRAMFHRMALSMHPDRHAASDDVEFQAMIYTIYKRVSEGYRVLMDPEQRKEYDERLSDGNIRLVKKERKKVGGDLPENQVTNHLARKFFIIGLKAEREGDLAGAQLNYKFALEMEESNQVIQERMARVTKWMGGKKSKKKKW